MRCLAEWSEIDGKAAARDRDETVELVVGPALGFGEVIVEVDAGGELHVGADLDFEFRAEMHFAERPAVAVEAPAVMIGVAEADASAGDERQPLGQFPIAVKSGFAIEGAGLRAGVADEPEEGRHPRRFVFEFDFDLLGVGLVIVEDGLVNVCGLGREVLPLETVAEEALDLIEASAAPVHVGQVMAGLEAAEESVPFDFHLIAEDALIVFYHTVFDLGGAIVDARLDFRRFDVRLSFKDVVCGGGRYGQGCRGKRRSEEL